MTSKVYIVLPVYNWEKYLLQQLMSIYYQDYDNWHLVLINDWSTDKTLDIINKFISDYSLSKKVAIINQKNKWLNKSIEVWLTYVKSLINDDYNNYVIYCDADDLMLTNKLSYQVSYMEEHSSCDLSYHDLILIDQNNWILEMSYFRKIKSIFCNIGNDSFSEYCLSNHMPSTTIMFKAEYIDLLLPFPVKFPFQDWRTALVFSAYDKGINKLDIPLGLYRRYPSQMSNVNNSNQKKAEMLSECIKSIERLKDKKWAKNSELFIKYYKSRIKWLQNNNPLWVQMFKTCFCYPRILTQVIFNIFF